MQFNSQVLFFEKNNSSRNRGYEIINQVCSLRLRYSSDSQTGEKSNSFEAAKELQHCT